MSGTPRLSRCRIARSGGHRRYIEHESGSRATAEAFVERIVAQCERLASMPASIGRPRPELRPGYRSVTYGNHVIFLRYADEDGPRSHLYVVDIIHGRRDLDAYFAEFTDEDDIP